MASNLVNTEEIQQIVLETPDISDDSWYTWSVKSTEDSGSNSESEVAEIPHGGKREEQASTSTAAACCVSAGRRRQ